MQRVLNWDAKLVEFTTMQLNKPFTWGDTDCASLVRGALHAMYGQDLWPEQHLYDSLLSAKHVLDETGGVAAQLLALGATEVHEAFIQQGDIVIGEPLDEDFADNVFVMVSDQLLSATIDAGVRLLPLAAMPLNAQVLRVPYGW